MCMADYADGDGGQLISEGKRKARKAHQCGECFRTIEPGEAYEFSTYAHEGSMTTYKVCVHCAVAMAWLGDNCGGWLWGGIWEDIQEHVDEYRSVYPIVARQLKRLSVWADHDWKVHRGPRKGARLPVPAMPVTVE